MLFIRKYHFVRYDLIEYLLNTFLRFFTKFPVLRFHLAITFVNQQYLLVENIEYFLSFCCDIIAVR